MFRPPEDTALELDPEFWPLDSDSDSEVVLLCNLLVVWEFRPFRYPKLGHGTCAEMGCVESHVPVCLPTWCKYTVPVGRVVLLMRMWLHKKQTNQPLRFPKQRHLHLFALGNNWAFSTRRRHNYHQGMNGAMSCWSVHIVLEVRSDLAIHV